MKKFILKSLVFTLPFLLLHLINVLFYDVNDGDLIRVGYLYSNPCSNKSINSQFKIKKTYKQVSQIDISKENKFNVITFGDSFSDQDSLGYQNYLAQRGFSVLDIDKSLGENSIERLIQFANGDFFDKVKTEYVVLETVERRFIDYAESVKITSAVQTSSIKKNILSIPKEHKSEELDFFSETTLKAPLSNILYEFEDKPQISQTFKVRTDKNTLFSNHPDHLLFYQDDYLFLSQKNSYSAVNKANDIINHIREILKKKNIKLILLIAPDKYDIYYPYISHQEKYQKPLFFHNLESLPKKYTLLESFKALSKAIEQKKNVYYYADTHWSPIGAEIIANEIAKEISICQ